MLYHAFRESKFDVNLKIVNQIKYWTVQFFSNNLKFSLLRNLVLFYPYCELFLEHKRFLVIRFLVIRFLVIRFLVILFLVIRFLVIRFLVIQFLVILTIKMRVNVSCLINEKINKCYSVMTLEKMWHFTQPSSESLYIFLRCLVIFKLKKDSQMLSFNVYIQTRYKCSYACAFVRNIRLYTRM